MTKLLYPDLSYKLIGCAIKVHKTLGIGLPEHCYQKALLLELNDNDIRTISEVQHKVYYNNQVVGTFRSDIIVDNKIILELKSADKMHDAFTAQLLNYMRITGLKVGYILNFGNLLLDKKRLII